MKTLRASRLIVPGVVLALGLSGCDSLTALTKLADCSAGFLTSGDILALNASARDFLSQQTPPVEVPQLTEDQAQALATFLELNNSNCFTEISALITQADSDPDSVQGLADLAAAFEGTDNEFDPQNAQGEDIQHIFNDVFSGNEGLNQNEEQHQGDGPGPDGDSNDGPPGGSGEGPPDGPDGGPHEPGGI